MQRAPARPMKLAQKVISTKTPSPTAASQLYVAHGLLGNAGNWATAARHLVEHPALKDRLRRAITVDMRNHGNSAHSTNHSNAALASDLEAVVLREQQELSRAFSVPAMCTTQNAILIGHSMGGMTIMGSLLRRANEARLLPSWLDAVEDAATEAGVAAAPYGAWPAARRRECAAGMRAVNEEFNFAASQPISEVLFHHSPSSSAASSGPDSNIAARVPRLGRVAGAIIVDVTPTMRLGEQRSGADNVKETLDRMNRVRLDAIHSYDDAKTELIRVGMTDQAMRDFVTTNIVLDPRDRTKPAQWKCNLPVLAADYGSFQPSITSWFASVGSTPAGSPTAPQPCTLPVLFVFGEKSPYNEMEHRQHIPRFFTNATQVEVAGAGHFVHYEKTGEFADVVAPFIASLTAQP